MLVGISVLAFREPSGGDGQCSVKFTHLWICVGPSRDPGSVSMKTTPPSSGRRPLSLEATGCSGCVEVLDCNGDVNSKKKQLTPERVRRNLWLLACSMQPMLRLQGCDSVS